MAAIPRFSRGDLSFLTGASTDELRALREKLGTFGDAVYRELPPHRTWPIHGPEGWSNQQIGRERLAQTGEARTDRGPVSELQSNDRALGERAFIQRSHPKRKDHRQAQSHGNHL